MVGTRKTLPLLQARTVLVLRGHEMRAYMADHKRPSASVSKKNVLIYGQGRSGTTLLESLMVSTGHFTGYHEALNTVTREVFWPTKFMRGLGRQSATNNIIAHVKPEHLGQSRRRPVDARNFLEALIEDGWFIVHIQRHDLVRKIMSKYVAKARGDFHKTDDTAEDIRLNIPESEFTAQYERRLSWLSAENALLNGLPHMRISYEEQLDRPERHQRTVDGICDQLGLACRPVSTRLKKIEASSPSDFLVNAEELRSAFVARGWEWTL